MTRLKLSPCLTALCLAAFGLSSVTLTACGDRKASDESGDSSSSSADGSTTQEPIPTTSGSATTPETTTTAEPTTGGSNTASASESGTTTENTGVTTGEPACMDAAPMPNDSDCTDASGCGCDSGKCFLVPILGGFCGECLADADCSPGGCTVPNPIDGIGSTCNMGEPGAGCETSDVCTDPANQNCGTLLEVMGIIKVSTCGECAVNADCTADPMLGNCTPTYDVMNFTGQYKCVADGSVPQDGGCNLADDGMDAPIGNKACESGFCGEASVMGLLKLGICGECNSNSDCPAQKPTCTDPLVDLDNAALVGAVCM